jgi:hypothetical protein
MLMSRLLQMQVDPELLKPIRKEEAQLESALTQGAVLDNNLDPVSTSFGPGRESQSSADIDSLYDEGTRQRKPS